MKYGHYVAAALALALSACSSGSVKETLGLSRAAPDEFRVVSRPPLSVPPQFGLRPPSTREESPNQLPADQQAKSLMSGPGSKKVQKERAASSAESQFLKKAGADMADPKVRDELVEEKFAAQEKQESESWWDILSLGSEKKDPLVDAKGEAERIQKNEDEGKSVTEGNTPEVKARDRGVLGRILGD